MIFSILGLVCLIYALVLWRYANVALRRNKLGLIKRGEPNKIAFLIPARYESAVIGGLLESITQQTIPVRMQDVYVIVESLEDPTVAICQKFGASVILRSHPERQRKGYALDEAIKQIFAQGRHYDLYFIFDADNRLAPNYLEEMLKIYTLGYQMATGYRNAKNKNKNVIAAVSALTFTMINTMGNKNRIKYGANIVFSGTGCYIDGSLVDQWRGWPFHALTEDYEMSLYAILHNVSTFYNEKATFYDEQPTSYQQTVAQRVRWIKGYFSARHQYIPQMKKRPVESNQGSLIKECVGVKPIIWALIGVICIMLGGIEGVIIEQQWLILLISVLGVLALVYVILMVITILMIKRENLKLSRQIKLKTILYNPIYLLSYVPCALKALFTKNVSWTPIQHGSKNHTSAK